MTRSPKPRAAKPKPAWCVVDVKTGEPMDVSRDRFGASGMAHDRSSERPNDALRLVRYVPASRSSGEANRKLKIAVKALEQIGRHYKNEPNVHPWKHAMNSGSIAREALSRLSKKGKR